MKNTLSDSPVTYKHHRDISETLLKAMLSQTHVSDGINRAEDVFAHLV